MAKAPRAASGQLTRLKSEEAREAEYLRIEQKKRDAAALVWRHIVEKKSLADCWFEVKTDSTASRTQAKRMAGRLIKWYRQNFPIEIRQLLFLKGYDDDKIIDLIGEKLLGATTLVKKRTRKWKTTNDEGETVWIAEYDFIEVPDTKMIADGLQKLITLSGHHARRALGPTDETGRPPEDPRNVTEDPNTVAIGTRKKIADDDWQKRFQAVTTESTRSGRADKILKDLEQRVAQAEAQAGQVTRPTPRLRRQPASRASGH